MMFIGDGVGGWSCGGDESNDDIMCVTSSSEEGSSSCGSSDWGWDEDEDFDAFNNMFHTSSQRQQRTLRRQSDFRCCPHGNGGEEKEHHRYETAPRRRHHHHRDGRRHRKRKKGGPLFQQPSIVVGMWLVEAGPANGNWAALDQMIIFSASSNASQFLTGQAEVDVAGFALHPNPADTYHAGGIHDWEARGTVPEVAKRAGGAAGVRYRPLGGPNDGGSFVWVCGQMVARGHDSVCFLCVDLELHGPIRADGVAELERAGVFDRFRAGDPDALVQNRHIASPGLCQARLAEFDTRSCRVEYDHVVKGPVKNSGVVTPPQKCRTLDTLPPSRLSPEQAKDFDYCEHHTVSDDASVAVDDVHDLHDLQIDMSSLDIDNERQWATLVQGSRVL